MTEPKTPTPDYVRWLNDWLWKTGGPDRPETIPPSTVTFFAQAIREAVEDAFNIGKNHPSHAWHMQYRRVAERTYPEQAVCSQVGAEWFVKDIIDRTRKATVRELEPWLVHRRASLLCNGEPCTCGLDELRKEMGV